MTWSALPPSTDWTAAVMPITSLASQSTQYVFTSISGPTDPTSASVSFAFVGPYGNAPQAAEQVITSSTVFTAGSWPSGQTASPWTAQILVGPAGAITLTPGSYVMWVQVSASPETPVLFSGPLVVS